MIEALHRVGDIDLFVRVDGEDDGVPLLMVMGLGSQLEHWPFGLVESFVDRGFRVIRFDNRDTGLSTHFDGVVVDIPAVMAAAASGDDVSVPYLLTDMAADAVGVLDVLGVDAAHIMGVSMGGMIVQTIAIEHPTRVLSMTSIMSTTGESTVGAPTAEAITQLLGVAPQTEDEAVARDVASAHIWGSPEWVDEDVVEERTRRTWRRNHDGAGQARQFAAVLASEERSEALASLDVPTTVVHGTADTLVTPSGGERTAELIPDAELRLVDGMGHDVPHQVWPNIVEAVLAGVQRAR